MKYVWGEPSGRADGPVSSAAGSPRRVVAAIAFGVAGVLALSACGTSTDDARRPDQAVLAGADTPSPTAKPTDSGPDIDPDLPPGETPAPTPVGGLPWDTAVSDACATAVVDEAGNGLQEVAQTADDGGVISFWSAGRQWVACDMLTGTDATGGTDAADGAQPVLVASSDGGREHFDKASLSLSSTPVTDADGETTAVRFAAAGLLPFPLLELTYTFPDGHTEEARFVRSDDGSGDTWWSVTYTPTDGVLVDPAGDPTELDPLTISIVGGGAEAFRVPWAEISGQRSE